MMKGFRSWVKDHDWVKSFVYTMLGVSVVLLVIYAVSLFQSWKLQTYPEVIYDIEQPYEIINEKVVLIPEGGEVKEYKVFKPGQKVPVRQVYCKYHEPYHSTLTIKIENGYYEHIKTIESDAEPGCYDKVSATARVPLDTHEGVFRLVYDMSTEMNEERTDNYEFYTEWFYVDAD